MTMWVALLPLLVATSSAFTTNVYSVGSHVAPLNVAASMDWEDETLLMRYAQDCASSDSCSLDDAQTCLSHVIRIQSGCSSGSLIGSSVCEDVDVAAELVANLREKIKQKSQQLSIVSAGTNALNISLVLLFFAASITGMTYASPDVAPFTMQEWWWAVRDGYLPMMFKEYFQNGGLVTVDYKPEVTAFTMQEIWWSLRDGYLPLMLKEYFTSGGLSSDEIVSSVPFTPQEWSFAIQGGYLDQMITRNFLNGGLSDVAPSDMDTLPITPQEWVMAAQGGYLHTLAKSYFEKGGL